MKTIFRQALFLAWVLVTGLTCNSAEAAPEEMKPLRQQFELDLEKVKSNVGALDQNYLAALNRLEESEKKLGNLDAVLKIRKEVESHGDGTGYTVETFKARFSDYPALRDTQSKYIVERIKIERALEEAVARVAQVYFGRLTILVGELTKKSRIEDAIAVTEERKRIAGLMTPVAKKSKSETEMVDSEPIRVRAHLVAKAEAELFHNGKSVYLRRSDEEGDNGTDAKSSFFDIQAGDVIVVRVRGDAVFRSLALAMELPDEDRAVFFESGDVKVIGSGASTDPTAVDAKAIEAAPAVHPQSTVPDRPWVIAWEEHRLEGGGFLKPEPQGEWVLWGAVLTPEMLERKAEKQ